MLVMLHCNGRYSCFRDRIGQNCCDLTDLLRLRSSYFTSVTSVIQLKTLTNVLRQLMSIFIHFGDILRCLHSLAKELIVAVDC